MQDDLYSEAEMTGFIQSGKFFFLAASAFPSLPLLQLEAQERTSLPPWVEIFFLGIYSVVTNARACAHVHRRAAALTFFANFSLGLYCRIYSARSSPNFCPIVLSSASLLSLLVGCEMNICGLRPPSALYLDCVELQ